MKKTNNVHIDDWIADYLTGEIQPDEQRQLHEWISASEDHRAYFLRQKEIWFSCINETDEATYDADSAFRHFQERVNATRSQQPSSAPRPQAHKLAYLRYVAAVACVCLVAYLSFQQGATQLRQSLTQITVEAPIGSQTRLVLPDGSAVVLNAGSRLSYPQDFGLDSRQVNLEGEGYFEVTPNANLPFQVSSSNIQVHVLGTKFDFKDYADEETASVTLHEGKVALHNRLKEEHPMLLAPDERMVMDKTNGKMVKEKFPSAESLEWTAGELVFNNTPLTEVLRVLERNYGMHFRFATDKVSDFGFNGRFQRSECSIKDILEVLQATGRIKYEIHENDILLYQP